jgi:hypothetical protein
MEADGATPGYQAGGRAERGREGDERSVRRVLRLRRGQGRPEAGPAPVFLMEGTVYQEERETVHWMSYRTMAGKPRADQIG